MNPVFAFNSTMVGMPVAGPFTSSQFMNCALASATMLTGVTEHVMEQLAKTETFETIPEEDIVFAKDTLGRATLDAMTAAEQWLAEKTASESDQSRGSRWAVVSR